MRETRRTEVRHLPCVLTEPELLVKGGQLAVLTQKIEAEEDAEDESLADAGAER